MVVNALHSGKAPVPKADSRKADQNACRWPRHVPSLYLTSEKWWQDKWLQHGL